MKWAWFLLVLGIISCKSSIFEGKHSIPQNQPDDEGKITDFDESLAGYLFNPSLVAFENPTAGRVLLRGLPGALQTPKDQLIRPIHFFIAESRETSPDKLTYKGSIQSRENGEFSYEFDNAASFFAVISVLPPPKLRYVTDRDPIHSLAARRLEILPYRPEPSQSTVGPQEEVVPSLVKATSSKLQNLGEPAPQQPISNSSTPEPPPETEIVQPACYIL